MHDYRSVKEKADTGNFVRVSQSSLAIRAFNVKEMAVALNLPPCYALKGLSFAFVIFFPTLGYYYKIKNRQCDRHKTARVARLDIWGWHYCAFVWLLKASCVIRSMLSKKKFVGSMG